MNKNSDWLNLIPQGWKEPARKMIRECEALDSTYYIIDLKEKMGSLRIYSYHEANNEIDNIEKKYCDMTKTMCCHCGHPAVKTSRPYVLPFCDDCGIDREEFYVRF